MIKHFISKKGGQAKSTLTTREKRMLDKAAKQTARDYKKTIELLANT